MVFLEVYFCLIMLCLGIFLTLPSLLFTYYGFQVCVFMSFLGVPISLHVCVLPCFFVCWFSFSVLFHSGLFAFVFACFLKMEKEGMKLDRWGYREYLWRDDGQKTVIRIYCMKKSISILKERKTETQIKREREEMYIHTKIPFICVKQIRELAG